MKLKIDVNECEPDAKRCSFCHRSVGVVGAVLGPKGGPMICENCNSGISILFERRSAIIKEAMEIVAAKEADGTYNKGPECDCPSCLSSRMLMADKAFIGALAKLAADEQIANEEERVPAGTVLQ